MCIFGSSSWLEFNQFMYFLLTNKVVQKTHSKLSSVFERVNGIFLMMIQINMLVDNCKGVIKGVLEESEMCFMEYTLKVLMILYLFNLSEGSNEKGFNI